MASRGEADISIVQTNCNKKPQQITELVSTNRHFLADNQDVIHLKEARHLHLVIGTGWLSGQGKEEKEEDDKKSISVL